MARSSEVWKVVVEGTALAAEVHNQLKVSHRQAKGLIDCRCVKVNGQEAKTYGIRLLVDDQILVEFDTERTYEALPHPSKSRDIPFEVLWEDKHLVFVNKPAGLLTVPAENHQDPCLAEAITDFYRRRGYKRFQLYIAHRLDRYTSGVLVFAKTPEALNGLKNIFAEHHLHRIYKAILVGELPENAGTLSDKLVERKSLKMDVVDEKSHSKHDLKGAKLAVTHYRVLERLPGHTVVEVKLETGRRNQIRVQFAERGFPLLGDQVYGTPSNNIGRQALHAELLGFRHPVTEDTVTVSAAMPADMENVLRVLRNVRRVVRAESGVTGEEGIYKPKITKEHKNERHQRAERFAPEGKPAASGRPGMRTENGPTARPRTRPEGDGTSRSSARPEANSSARPYGRSEGGSAARPRTRPDSEGPARTGSRPASRSGAAAGPRPERPERPARTARPAGRPEAARAPRTLADGSHAYVRPEGEAPRPRSPRPAGKPPVKKAR